MSDSQEACLLALMQREGWWEESAEKEAGQVLQNVEAKKRT